MANVIPQECASLWWQIRARIWALLRRVGDYLGERGPFWWD